MVEEYYKPARGETRVDAQGKSGRPQVGAKVKSHLFALLDCPARTMRVFLADNIQREAVHHASPHRERGD